MPGLEILAVMKERYEKVFHPVCQKIMGQEMEAGFHSSYKLLHKKLNNFKDSLKIAALQ